MRTAVILSGCGVQDGSEIHESVCLLLSLDMMGDQVRIFAPDKPQAAVINHMTGNSVSATRNILAEAARIARGKIGPLSTLDVNQFDAIILPGGMGAANNLCDFSVAGPSCRVYPELERILIEANKSSKILGFMCIAPVIAACLFKGVKVTVGDHGATAQACEKMGAHHVICNEDQACIDDQYHVVSVPAYMKAKSVHGCFNSAMALVKAIHAMI